MTAFAFVFPGQGSQSVGMLDAWGDNAAVRQTLAEASEALGENLAKLIHEGPKDQLDLTTNTQPVMLTAAIACYRAWRAEGGAEPAAVAGHSLGEYSALVAAGAGRAFDNNSPAELGARTVEILDAAYRSASSGSAERVRTIS